MDERKVANSKPTKTNKLGLERETVRDLTVKTGRKAAARITGAGTLAPTLPPTTGTY